MLWDQQNIIHPLLLIKGICHGVWNTIILVLLKVFIDF